MLRYVILASLLASAVGCAHTHGEIRAVADHDVAGPRAGVSVAATW
jgi:hypothetical protein